MESVKFTHLVTGKALEIFDKKAVAAIFHGFCQSSHLPKDTACVFLVVDKIRDPIPVVETEEEVRTKLGVGV